MTDLSLTQDHTAEYDPDWPIPAAAVLDGTIIALWLQGVLTTAGALVAHGVCVLAVVALQLVSRTGRAQWREVSLQALLLLLLGPIGGPALLIAGLGSLSATPEMKAEPEFQLRPRSRPEALTAAIRQGRRRQTVTEAQPPFAKLFLDGDLQRQFRAIAVISRFYRPEMLPALQVALASPVPAIRVQAAAIFAKLRGSFGERAKKLLAAANADLTPEQAKLRAIDCAEVAASGFVTADQKVQLEGLRQMLLANAEFAADPLPFDPPSANGQAAQTPRMRRYSCGGMA